MTQGDEVPGVRVVDTYVSFVTMEYLNEELST